MCICKKTPQKLHTQLKNIFHKIPQANDVQHTLIFSSLLRSFFLNKKREMIVVIHYIDCIPTKGNHPILWRSLFTVDVIILFLNTDINILCKHFHFNKKYENFSLLKYPNCLHTTQSIFNKTQSLISLIFILLRRNKISHGQRDITL